MSAAARWRRCAVLAVAYIIAGEIGRSVYLSSTQVPFIWPPTGLTLAALLLYGPRLWPGVAIGAFASVMFHHRHIDAALAIMIANVSVLFLAWWLLARVLRMHSALDRARDVIAFGLVAFLTSLLNAAGIVTLLRILGRVSLERAAILMPEWWWSHMSADLLIAPLLLTWLAPSRSPSMRPAPSVGEMVALCLCVVVVDVALFTGLLRSWFPGTAAPFYLLPLLLWAGMRFGTRGAATASFAVGTMAIASATTSHSPFAQIEELESFVSVTAIATLLLSATGVERLRAIHRQATIQYVSLDPIVSVDTRGRIVEFNPSAEELFGRRAVQVIGKDATLLIPEHHHGALRRILRGQTGLNNLTGRRFDSTIVRADGTEREVEISVATVNVGGESLITGFIRDRTEERRAEHERLRAHVVLEDKVRERTRELTRTNQELERSTALLRQAEEMAQLGSFELDIPSGRVEWSDELFRIYGVERSAFVPSTASFLAAVHPDDRASVVRVLAAAIASSDVFELDERIVRPNGEIRCLTSRGKVFVNAEGTAERMTGCCQDTTERHAAEEARYRLADIVASSDDAIIGLSTDLRIETWNAAATKIFGYEANEVLGRNCELLVACSEVPWLEERLARTIAGEHLPHFELAHVRKDRTLFDASVTISAIRDRNGVVIGLSKVLRDITQQKSFEAQLKSSLIEKEVLLREIHHRVKNNLQVISSLLNLQVASETSEQSRRSLLESQNRIQSMALVHQQLYRATDLGSIDVTEYLRALAIRLLATYSLGGERISLDVEGPSMKLPIDRVIPCGLIVNEIVANAIEHAFPDEREGHISIKLEHRDPGMAVLTIRDDGIGIPVELTQRGQSSFGLQIARTLTQQLDGTITIARDVGTVVQLAFPVNETRTGHSEIVAAAR